MSNAGRTAGGNDIIAKTFAIPLFVTTWFFRFAVILGPAIAYIVAYRLCLGLQHRDRHMIEHGVETGIIKLLPNGAYVEVERPPAEEKLAPILQARPPVAIPAGRPELDGVEPPEARRRLGRLRVALNHRFTADLGPPVARSESERKSFPA